MTAVPLRPDVSVLIGASQTHAVRRSGRLTALRLALASARAISRRSRSAAAQRVAALLSVTLTLVRAYALTVGSLACLAIAGFTITPALGWVVSGICGLWFNHGLQRQE